MENTLKTIEIKINQRKKNHERREELLKGLSDREEKLNELRVKQKEKFDFDRQDEIKKLYEALESAKVPIDEELNRMREENEKIRKEMESLRSQLIKEVKEKNKDEIEEARKELIVSLENLQKKVERYENVYGQSAEEAEDLIRDLGVDGEPEEEAENLMSILGIHPHRLRGYTDYEFTPPDSFHYPSVKKLEEYLTKLTRKD